MAGMQQRPRGRVLAGSTRQEVYRRIVFSPLLWRKIGLVAITALVMWLLTGGWAPAFPWRSGYAPERDVTARVAFSSEDRRATDQARQKARAEVVPYYQHDPRLLEDFSQAVTNPLLPIVGSKVVESVPEAAWQELLRPTRTNRSLRNPTEERPRAEVPLAERSVAFELIQRVFRDDGDLSGFRRVVTRSVEPFLETGLLLTLEHDLYQGSQSTLLIHPPGQEDIAIETPVAAVRLADLAGAWRQRIIGELAGQYELDEDTSARLGGVLFPWMETHVPVTLTWNRAATDRAADAAMAEIEPVMLRYRPGDRLEGIFAGEPLTTDDLTILREEQEAFVAGQSVLRLAGYALANFGMYAALAILGAIFFRFQEPRILHEWPSLMLVLASVAGAVVVAYYAACDPWRLELISMVALSIAMSLAFTVQVSFFLSAAAALILTVSLGQGLFEFVVLVSSMSVASLLSGRVRTRTRLLHVGFAAGVVAFATTLGIGTLSGQPLMPLVWEAARFALASVLAGMLMTPLLPYYERLAGIQTDLSLLELGNASHPLLQELVRRAPGTYNHSITVASLAEAACESIQANGLLCRVGAYFHDIGKMRAPGYFVENQSDGDNAHDRLPPRVSALAIIAHVRDGVDLARQHHLPQPIIDLIEQHHGNTLVEYFLRKEERDRIQKHNDDPVDETAFRYGGPRPQTREAAVLMLADAVESASRVLDDPTPKRLESLIQSLAMKRLQDGQFDQCRLTFRELRSVQDSLRKSLIAIHHARIKYPEAPLPTRRPSPEPTTVG